MCPLLPQHPKSVKQTQLPGPGNPWKFRIQTESLSYLIMLQQGTSRSPVGASYQSVSYQAGSRLPEGHPHQPDPTWGWWGVAGAGGKGRIKAQAGPNVPMLYHGVEGWWWVQLPAELADELLPREEVLPVSTEQLCNRKGSGGETLPPASELGLESPPH